MNDPAELTLGRYQIVSLVARGGMSEVFKAYQPGLDRYVAVKVLHAHLADEPSFIDRFEREAASVARLRHPNIVQVIDFDCQDGRYYMVMEFIEGASLKDDLEARAERGETHTPQEAAYLISAVASALDYAHNRGMMHRDIKPANILFTSEGQVVLTDFGIAHIVGTTLYTENESFLGTPAYMSPEQACGSPGDGAGKITLWEAGSGLPLFSLPGHGSLLVTGLAFSPDGKYLASASVDGTARLFVIPPEDLLDLARARLTRGWTVEECQQYLHIEVCPAPAK